MVITQALLSLICALSSISYTNLEIIKNLAHGSKKRVGMRKMC